MIEVGRIVELYRQRKSRLAPVHSKMHEIKDQYNNNVTVPLPELDTNETPSVANLISQGVDQMAMRIASTVPSLTYPAVKPGNEQSESFAEIRRLANYGWWQQNHFDRKQRKRSKWLVAYAVTPVVLRPNFKLGIPAWHLADPLSTFPAPMADEDDILPSDGILAYTRHLSWLNEMYPQASQSLELGSNPSPDTTLEILEYIDADEHVLVAVGRSPDTTASNPFFGPQPRAPGLPYAELERFPNKVGRCTLVYPTRPSLECPISQFDGMPSVYRLQARAMALWMIAIDRSIFPEQWFVSRPNETVDVMELPDGRAGIPGKVRGGDLKEVMIQSNPQIGQMLQDLERTQRVTAGISSDFGGENPSNVRTGRAGEQLLSATVDYWVQEAQETLSLAYQEENRLAISIARNYFGDTPKSFYVGGFKAAKGPVDYTPNIHFENDNQTVSWPQAGADVNSLVVGLGQRLGLDEISVWTAQELDPYIDDAEEERRRLTVQSLDKAFMASIDQAVAGGQIGPTELSKFNQKVLQGMDKYKAWDAIHQEMQQAQAAQQQPPEAGGPTPGSPQAMPGLSAPGQQAALGMPQPGPAAGVSAPQPGLQHMQQLLASLKGGQKPPMPAGAQ